VEFRVCEVQISDFENAAFACFVVLLTRAILSFNLNFYIPISKVDENTRVAQTRDAARKGKFYFRRKPFPSWKILFYIVIKWLINLG
jgi:glutamate--cysteine ligase catalytic subunit